MKKKLLTREKEINQHLLKEINSLPTSPGVYYYYDKEHRLLYIGKAKNVKKRVKSYFNKQVENFKTKLLVSKIASVKFIIVNSEIEALLLENNLIKKHQPKYNILLKDDKTFPWIVIKRESFPRVTYTRRIVNKKDFHFGPYTNVKAMHALIGVIKELYKIRTCSYNLSEENIKKGKFRVCLEYHIKNCDAPCIGLQQQEEYELTIEQIKTILKGGGQDVIKTFRQQMQVAAKGYLFEEAHEIKQKIKILENYVSRTIIVHPSYKNIDTFSVVSDENYGYVNFIKVVNGAIIQSDTIEIKKKLEESNKQLLIYGIIEIRRKLNSDAKEIIVPLEVDIEEEGLDFNVPQRGDKKKLLSLSEKNLKYYYLDKKRQRALKSELKSKNKVLLQLKKDLRLKVAPTYIECFDNSNLQGTTPVAACVVFKNGKPSKKDYRHFNIKTVVGSDDFASMKEVVYRRYSRLIRENRPLPQLIVIDGGKGQVSSAVESLSQLNLLKKVTVIGIAKRLEEIFFPNDPVPIYLDKKSQSLKIIQHIRNEAHRFGITHHRKKRMKGTLKTELLNIDGVGETTANKLFKTFGSLSRIKAVKQEELLKVINLSQARKLKKYFSKENNSI